MFGNTRAGLFGTSIPCYHRAQFLRLQAFTNSISLVLRDIAPWHHRLRSIYIHFLLYFVFAGMSRLSPFKIEARFFWDPNPVASDTTRRPSILTMFVSFRVRS
ncbi:hypothetical protein ARMGADRAFT_670017 [Armillaria gallica]|uniref:Uncharacterized protein n=1 Tax=Armillaria gallica TaxID=47427 RepID=A0A2H3CK36_ARMGA|nr:hypothetical protein ARMGADRAFT_670017 [Armillaria gallica]